MTLDQAIAQGVQRMDLRIPPAAPQRLAAYVALLERWNRVYNLTAVRDPAAMVSRHILDSLAVLPWLQGPRVLDVGSGAGLPGIPLALARPELEFYLLDSSGKRTRFMIQATVELGLGNVQVVQCRVQAYRPEGLFNSVLARAFGSLSEILAAAGRLCAPGARLLAMKGAYPAAELQALPPGFTVQGVYPLAVPGLDGERHLVHLVPLDSPVQAQASWPGLSQ